MSAITLEGKLSMIEQEERAFSQGRRCGALLEAPDWPKPRQTVGDLGWLSAIHRGRVVKDFFLARGASQRLRVEQLPGYYAPDLNPDEGISGSTSNAWS
jgi:hypothetical protein